MPSNVGLCLSLIIATRERADTLGYTLQTALDQSSNDFEILVSDNASEDETRSVVQSLAELDSRLRYIKTNERLSMCDNYEFALEHARGTYVVFIGDDDAVMPGALDRLIMELRAADSATIFMWPLHVYDWPVGDEPAKIAHLSSVTRRRMLNLKSTGRYVVSVGGWRHGHLPSPYHCAVPRRLLEELRIRTGRVFHSTQPDVFTAMALPAFADEAIDVGYVVTLNGRSARSNGRGFVAVSARGNIERFIREYRDYRFHPSLCSEFPASANMIPDAVLLAKDMFPEVYGETSFNYDAMWAYLCRLRFVSYRAIWNRRHEIRKRHPFHLVRFFRYALIQEAAILRRRLLTWLVQRRESADQATPANIRAFVVELAAREC